MDWIRYHVLRLGLSSALTQATFALPSHAVTTSSRTALKSWQDRLRGAENATKTGRFDWSTSETKFASPVSTIRTSVPFEFMFPTSSQLVSVLKQVVCQARISLPDFLFINRSSKALTTKFPGKEARAETILLRAGCRGFDIASYRRRVALASPPHHLKTLMRSGSAPAIVRASWSTQSAMGPRLWWRGDEVSTCRRALDAIHHGSRTARPFCAGVFHPFSVLSQRIATVMPDRIWNWHNGCKSVNQQTQETDQPARHRGTIWIGL